MGYCNPHYQRWHRYGIPTAGRPLLPAGPLCQVEDCGKARYQGRRYCVTHTMRWHKYRSLDKRPRQGRVFADGQGYLVEPTTDPILEWSSGRSTRQHRRVLLAKLGPGAHPCHWCGRAVTWDQSYPSAPDGLTVDHLDENKANNDPTNLVPSCGRCNLRRSNTGRKRDHNWRWLPREPTARP